MSTSDRFDNRQPGIVLGDVSQPNGVVIENLDINLDRPISSTTMQLRKLFLNLHK